MTPKEFFEQQLPTRITKEKAEKIGGTFQFKVSGPAGGDWYIDLTKADNFVASGNIATPKCTVSISDDDLLGIVNKTLNAQMAFMTGKLKVAGDMGLSLKLLGLLA